MSSYHVIAKAKSENVERVQLDLTLEQLDKLVVQPHKAGQAIKVDGTSIAPHDLVCLKITKAIRATSAIRDQIRSNAYQQLMSPAFTEKFIANEGDDVTDDFVTPCS